MRQGWVWDVGRPSAPNEVVTQLQTPVGPLSPSALEEAQEILAPLSRCPRSRNHSGPSPEALGTPHLPRVEQAGRNAPCWKGQISHCGHPQLFCHGPPQPHPGELKVGF